MTRARSSATRSSADVSFDGGDLDCGNGLLLLIRQHLDPLEPGQLLEFRSTEISVEEDLPAWCRLTGNELVSFAKARPAAQLPRLQGPAEPDARRRRRRPAPPASRCWPRTGVPVIDSRHAARRPRPPPPSAPLAVMGIGSWPRPRWMLQAMHEHLEGRLTRRRLRGDRRRRRAPGRRRAARAPASTWSPTASSAATTTRASSAAGSTTASSSRSPTSCRSSTTPRSSEAELQALDVPAARGPASGRLRPARPEPSARRARARVRAHADRPAGEGRAARPVPADAHDVAGVHLRSRLPLARAPGRGHRARPARGAPRLLAAGVAARPARRAGADRSGVHGQRRTRAASCAARSARSGRGQRELALRAGAARAGHGGPAARAARRCTSAAATGRATSGPRWRATTGRCCRFLADAPVGTLFLELAHPARRRARRARRAAARALRIGVGVVNQKQDTVETVDEIAARARRAVALFGAERVLLTPDCGFATFADNPIASAAASPRRSCARSSRRPSSSAARVSVTLRSSARGSMPYTRAGWPNSSVWPRRVSPSRSATRIDGSLPGG